jgi:outer membrane protein TolC
VKPLVILALISLGSLALAQALTLEEALARAEARTAVVNAQLELIEAENALARTLADPLALRPERLQAEQRLALGRVDYEQARYDAQLEIAQTYTQVLQAEWQITLAEKAREVSEQALEVARIRFERGSAIELEVGDAVIALEEAENNLRAAREGLALARTNLQGLLGLEIDALAPIFDLEALSLPPLTEVLSGLARHPQLLETAQGHELAALNVELLDPAYAPRVEIAAAELQLEQAESFALEVQRGLELQARGLYNQVETAAQTWAIEEEALANAEVRLALERQRLEAGLIAEISYRQSELNAMQAELAALQAEHGYLLALLELQAATLVPLEGLHEAAHP